MEAIQNILVQLGRYIAPETAMQLAKPLSKLRSEDCIAIEVLHGPETENEKDYASFRLKATQLEPTKTGRIFLQKEIVDLVKQNLHAISNQRYYVLPITFSPDFSVVDARWINQQMDELGLKTADICRQTGLNKSTLSLLFTGSRPITLMNRALFWHYIHGYRLAKSYQEALKNLSELPE